MPDKEDIINLEWKPEIPHPNFCRVCNKENCGRGIHTSIKEENNMTIEINLEQLNMSVWSGQFKASLRSGDLTWSEDELTWINDAVKQRLNRSFKGK